MLSQLFSDKTVLIVVTLIGMAICKVGIGQVAARGEWLHPMAILGYVFGVLILVIVAAALFGLKLPLMERPQAALIAVVALIIVKVVLTQLHRVLT
jgi:hypothetical protein